MKGIVFLGERQVEIREFEDPMPAADEVILEIKASGMCGSDLHVYRSPGVVQLLHGLLDWEEMVKQ